MSFYTFICRAHKKSLWFKDKKRLALSEKQQKKVNSKTLSFLKILISEMYYPNTDSSNGQGVNNAGNGG